MKALGALAVLVAIRLALAHGAWAQDAPATVSSVAPCVEIGGSVGASSLRCAHRDDRPSNAASTWRRTLSRSAYLHSN